MGRLEVPTLLLAKRKRMAGEVGLDRHPIDEPELFRGASSYIAALHNEYDQRSSHAPFGCALQPKAAGTIAPNPEPIDWTIGGEPERLLSSALVDRKVAC